DAPHQKRFTLKFGKFHRYPPASESRFSAISVPPALPGAPGGAPTHKPRLCLTIHCRVRRPAGVKHVLFCAQIGIFSAYRLRIGFELASFFERKPQNAAKNWLRFVKKITVPPLHPAYGASPFF